MSKGAAVDLATRGIRVNSVHPGLIHTPQAITCLKILRARSSRKNLFVVGRGDHYDLDKPQCVEQAMGKHGPFFKDNL
ncbi:SDR family oxidoreductase [Paraburkholderia sp. J63]|uniref:SDR family oxidoreductase n=1 Tax=Paraburkholderia sp. J63 TaxID=2805434 RepID=UPI002ABD98B5|nr:SDR family oxidoreductase [Paraburkholderia sp. J63]